MDVFNLRQKKLLMDQLLGEPVCNKCSALCRVVVNRVLTIFPHTQCGIRMRCPFLKDTLLVQRHQGITSPMEDEQRTGDGVPGWIELQPHVVALQSLLIICLMHEQAQPQGV